MDTNAIKDRLRALVPGSGMERVGRNTLNLPQQPGGRDPLLALTMFTGGGITIDMRGSVVKPRRSK